MKKSSNNMTVKKVNKNRVFRYINNRDTVAMPEIAQALQLSGPTVLSIVKEFQQDYYIEEVGEFQSTGGRKAKAYAAKQDKKYAIGVDITKNHISIVVTDLSESVLKKKRIRKSFSYTKKYLKELNNIIEEFIEEYGCEPSRILGVGIAVPAIVNMRENSTSNSHALGVHEMRGSRFEKHIPYKCVLVNDANAAAIAETAKQEIKKNMVYLFLSNTVGGAMLLNQYAGNITGEAIVYDGVASRIYTGDHWHSAEFGHMVLSKNGKECYCGKKGCLDAYCNTADLADLEEGDLKAFFTELECGNDRYREIWQEYLSYLSVAIDNLRMCYDCEIIIGGYIGKFIGPYIPQLQELVSEDNIFERSGDYVRACSYKTEASALGAAICLVEEFINVI